MRIPKKTLVWLLVLIVVAGGGYGVYRWLHRAKPVANDAVTQQSSSSVTTKPQPTTIHLLAAGDFLAHDTVNEAAKQPDGSYDYMPIMDQFTSIFHASDIRFCNDAQLNGGAKFGISGYPTFNSPTEFAVDMEKVGCNMVNTGTNHSFDRNQAAINATQDVWDGLPNMLAVAGQNRNQAEHDTVHYFTVKGVKFAFLAYTTYINTDAPLQDTYGVNVFSKSFASTQIKEAKAHGAQMIIASMRWGTEYSETVNAEQKQLAQWLADQGVDIVLGHGPHVLQTVQQLTGTNGNKTTVWYSLGDFIGTQLPPDTLFNGLATIDIDIKTHHVTHLGFLPIYMHYEWTAAQAKRQNNADLLARHNLKMYFLDQTTQAMIDSQQLQTTVAAQRQRIQHTLDTYINVPLITKQQYLSDTANT
ncbi:MAG TPA: CapA family protein [Candidatus Saccharimonadales bacterium]|nr:CapA family protein [Candidatus Saccharimonadales bacterium]